MLGVNVILSPYIIMVMRLTERQTGMAYNSYFVIKRKREGVKEKDVEIE